MSLLRALVLIAIGAISGVLAVPLLPAEAERWVAERQEQVAGVFDSLGSAPQDAQGRSIARPDWCAEPAAWELMASPVGSQSWACEKGLTLSFVTSDDLSGVYEDQGLRCTSVGLTGMDVEEASGDVVVALVDLHLCERVIQAPDAERLIRRLIGFMNAGDAVRASELGVGSVRSRIELEVSGLAFVGGSIEVVNLATDCQRDVCAVSLEGNVRSGLGSEAYRATYEVWLAPDDGDPEILSFAGKFF